MFSQLKKLATVRNVKWGSSDPYVFYQITPDRSITNKNNAVLAKSIHDMLKDPHQRIKVEEGTFVYESQPKVIFRIVMQKDSVRFFVGFPEGQWEKYQLKKFKNIWSKSSFVKTQPKEFELDVNRDFDICELKYARHPIFSLQCDKDKMDFFEALVNNVQSLEDNDKVVITYMIEPMNHRDWVEQAATAFREFRKGKMPRKLEFSKRNIIQGTARFLAEQMVEIKKDLDTMVTSEAPKQGHFGKFSGYGYGGMYGNNYGMGMSSFGVGGMYGNQIIDGDVSDLLVEGKLTSATTSKMSAKPYRVGMYVACNGINAEAMCRSIANSYTALDENNMLEYRSIGKAKQVDFLDYLEQCKLPPLDLNVNIMSLDEVAKLMCLPTVSMQDQYHQIEQLRHKEVEVPKAMFDPSGIPFCIINDRGKKREVFIQTKNYDDLCMPHTDVGAMRTGKTTHGANFTRDWLLQGFSAFAIDVADGDLVTWIRDSLPEEFPEDHIIDLDFGNLDYPIGLNWAELGMRLFNKEAGTQSRRDSRQVASRMSSALVEFINGNATYKVTDRMEHFLSASARAVMCDPESSLLEVILALNDKQYRQHLVNKFRGETRITEALQTLNEFSDDMVRQIVTPIMDRMSGFMSEEVLANSILQKNKLGEDGKPLINFRKWADGDRYPYFVGIRVPKDVCLAIPTDRIVTFLVHKLWLSIMSRYDTEKDKRNPCLLLMDEPHQFPSCGIVWDQMVREARKWRLKTWFLTHNFNTFGATLTKTFKDSGMQYSVFKTSKETYRSLSAELQPFSEEELMATPDKWYAVHKVFGGTEEGVPAFMGQMFTPPQKVKDRSYIREQCSKIYGRPADEVEADVTARYNRMK